MEQIKCRFRLSRTFYFQREVKFVAVLQTILLLAFCMKDTIYDAPYSDKKAVSISMMRLSADNNVLDIDEKVAYITGLSFTNPDLFNQGTHSMVGYKIYDFIMP